MAQESKRDLLGELRSQLAAAADCLSLIRDKQVSDANAVTFAEAQWAGEKYNMLMELMDEVDEKRMK